MMANMVRKTFSLVDIRRTISPGVPKVELDRACLLVPQTELNLEIGEHGQHACSIANHTDSCRRWPYVPLSEAELLQSTAGEHEYTCKEGG